MIEDKFTGLNSPVSLLIDALISAGIPFALFKEPDQTPNELQLMLGRVSCAPLTSANVNHSSAPCGFILAPFKLDEDALCLESSEYFRGSATELLSALTAAHGELNAAIKTVQQEQVLNAKSPAGSADASLQAQWARCEALNLVVRERYHQAFETFKKGLSSGRFVKLVLSHAFYQPMTKSAGRIFASLLTLRAAVNSFCYLAFFGAGHDLHLAATPEVLLKIKGRSLKTMSLAGTAQSSQALKPGFAWDDKNVREQALVTDYIREALLPFAESITASEPFTKTAGPVSHLCTELEAYLKPEADAAQLLKALHPTPAVCGLPKAEAFDFILQEEHSERGYYAGPVGFYQEGALELFVNLRSLSIRDGMIKLQAGGGLLAQSEEAAEWQETLHKLKTLQEAL